MTDKEKVVEYVMKTPYNTNEAILRELIDSISSKDDDSSIDEVKTKYTLKNDAMLTGPFEGSFAYYNGYNYAGWLCQTSRGQTAKMRKMIMESNRVIFKFYNSEGELIRENSEKIINSGGGDSLNYLDYEVDDTWDDPNVARFVEDQMTFSGYSGISFAVFGIRYLPNWTDYARYIELEFVKE